MKEKNINKKDGITLIALVITIIVMLILVGVTINMAVNGGLFGYAGNAVRDTELAKQDELKIANIESGKDYDYLIEKFANSGSDELTENQEYTDTNGAKAVIPKGFKLTSEKTVASGLVIEDKAGNQFVWIPASATTTLDFDNIRTTKNESDYVEPASGDETEYNAMRTSVINNGGFYIARYEAGYSMTEGRLSTNSLVTATPLSKKGAYPYNYINWSDAKTASQRMYDDDTKYGVKSTLCYGVQWDAMLSFLNKTEDEETDSTTWGNYLNAEQFDFTGKYYTATFSGGTVTEESWENDTTRKIKNKAMLLQTGATERNSENNIYDVAGNLFEWTMESYGSSIRIDRGGSYDTDGDLFLAFYRSQDSSNSKSSGIGFRVALFIL